MIVGVDSMGVEQILFWMVVRDQPFLSGKEEFVDRLLL